MSLGKVWSEIAGKKIVRVRSKGRCEIMIPGVCSGVPIDFSHRKGRGVGGTWAPSNGLHSCRACHQWIGNHKTMAYRNGWMVKGAYQHETMPVLLRGVYLVKLIDEPPYYVPITLIART